MHDPELEALLATLDEPKTTPADVRHRIWTNVATASDTGAMHEVPLSPIAEPPGRNRTWRAKRLGALAAVAAVCIGSIWMFRADDAKEVTAAALPTVELETACERLADVSDDFAQLTPRGVALQIEQLQPLRDAVANVIKELESADLADVRLARWNEMDRSLALAIRETSVGRAIDSEVVLSAINSAQISFEGLAIEDPDSAIAGCFSRL